MIQWSKSLNVGTSMQGQLITFPTAFSTEVYAIFLTLCSQRAIGYYGAHQYTKTSFYLSTAQDAVNFVWLAIGT